MNTILIVEDSSSFAKLLKARIQNALAVEVVLATCLAEAKALLHLNPERFFLALLDLNLPDAPNGEIVDLVLAHRIPGIVLTGIYKKELQEIFLKKGMLDYFIKDNPGVVDSVIHAIDRVQKNKKINILVVDDSRSARLGLCGLLQRYGFNLLGAENGEIALQLLTQEPVDLVIADYQMPVMDGLVFMKKLRTSYSRNELAAIGLSSYGNADLAVQFIKAGANDFLVKPFQTEELLCRVYQNLENSERYQDIVRLLDRQQAVMNHALDAIIIIDGEGRILDFNPASEQLFGFTRGVVIGKNIEDFVIPESLRAPHRQALHRFASKSAMGSSRLRRRMEFPGLRADGQTMDLQISLTSVVQKEGSQFIGFLQDITDRKQLLKSLEETLMVAEMASVAKSDFIANMSHEIRTPMNAVLGFTELALKTDLSPRVRDYLEKIDGASHSLMGVISDLLDFSKLESGQMKLDPITFDLLPLMERLADLFSKQVADKNIELVFFMPVTFDTVLFGDVIRLEQVLINLIRNAVKFTEKGTITVTLTPTMTTDKSVCLHCSVKDSGIGVDPEILPNLFAPFVQADGSISRKFGGIGLGLSICKRIVTLMGGRMWAKSEIGEGSEFGFEVCVAYHGENRRQKKMLPDSLWGKKVLVAEDNPLVRESLRDLLKDLLLEPVMVASGREALSQIMAVNTGSGAPFDYLLLDWRMPDMDGDVVAVEVGALLESITPKPVLPKIFLLPPFGVAEAISKGEKADVAGFIDKPVTRSRLIRGLSVEMEPQADFLDRRRERLLGQEKSTGKRVAGSRILLVQANDVNLRIARELLSRIGLVVEIAHTGQDAVDLATRFAFDLILMDLQIPDWGGFETMMRIRQDPHAAGVPIIALLSHADWEEKKRCLDAGMNDHLDLPWRAERLYGALCKWLKPLDSLPDLAGFLKEDHRFARVAGLDATAGLERVAGKKSLYRQLLARFAYEYSGSVALLQGHLQAKAWLPAEALVHAIKGAAHNLGAITLANVAAELEAALQAKEGVTLQAAMATFIYQMNLIMGGLLGDAVATEGVSGDAVVPRQDSGQMLGEISALLSALLDRLTSFSIEVEPWLTSLGELLQPTDLFFTFQELVKQIDAFHFVEAIELLHKLAGSFGCLLSAESLLVQEASQRESSRKRVLIVDDQPSNVNLLKAILTDFHRLVALNGQQALQAAHAQESPDLILLDIMMPEMNGYEVCRQLQAHPRTKEIPVIFVTAKKQVEDETEGFRLGGVDYITKPFNGEIVKRRVLTHLELKRHRDALEQEVQLRTTELIAAREEAERAKEAAESGNRAKSTFLAHMSHEIRTPLNAILGVNELLVETNATEEQRQYLEMSRKASESLLSLVSDVLDFSKIEAGQFDLEHSCFDLPALIAGAAEILALPARERGIRLHSELDVHLPKYVVGDPNRLRQILLNLMGNAVKFTLKGTVSLQVKRLERGAISFAIVDTGIGIAADKLTTIFHPFRQADLSTTRQYGGTGLGLTICALLVENMGGAIEVKSIEGQGSTFCFILELPEAERDGPMPLVSVVRQTHRASAVSADAMSEGLTILVVEDSEDNRILIKAFLKKSAHFLEFAENGQVAWELFRRKSYDVVLMDLQMPILDGYATTRKIRLWEKEQQVAPTPIIALTAHAMQEASVDAMEAGCDYYLSKPIAKKRLLEVLQQFVKR